MSTVRRRRAKASRYSLTEAVLGLSEDVSREAYLSLRPDLLRVFADRLELMDSFWSFEVVPDWLRVAPEQGDPRRIFASGGIAAQLHEYEAAELAYEAVLSGRRRWLVEHGYSIGKDYA